jgi:hypothetical protein
MVVLLVTIGLVFSQCEKNDDTDDTPTPAPRALTKTEILRHKPWILQEAYSLEANTLHKYERGATGNTINYDQEVITFTSANTGTFKNLNGVTTPFTWSFMNTQQTKLQVVLQTTGNPVLNYEMVALADSSFSAALTYKVNGVTNVLASFRRTWQ